jgi:hypothetical protein
MNAYGLHLQFFKLHLLLGFSWQGWTITRAAGTTVAPTLLIGTEASGDFSFFTIICLFFNISVGWR